MGFFKSLFGGSNTPETEKEKNRKNPRSSAKEQKVQLESVQSFSFPLDKSS